MNTKDFFNKVAFNWDNICNHNEIKINKIIGLSDIKPSTKILDVGTGTGILIKYLLEKSPSSITAIDVSENMIEIARNKYNNTNVNFKVCDIMDFNESGFDYIFLYSVYPHFLNKDELFNHIIKLLNPNGKIVIAHSESKEKINEIHCKNEYVKNDTLVPADVTGKLMSKYLKLDKVIDTDEMYYVSGIKE